MNLLDLFKRKPKHKYTLEFRKKYTYADVYGWGEIRSSYFLELLYRLQEKYNFEIVSTNINNCLKCSTITIRCYKKDKSAIFINFCMMAEDYIREVKF